MGKVENISISSTGEWSSFMTTSRFLFANLLGEIVCLFKIGITCLDSSLNTLGSYNAARFETMDDAAVVLDIFNSDGLLTELRGDSVK